MVLAPAGIGLDATTRPIKQQLWQVTTMWQFRKDGQRKWYWKEVDEMGLLLRRSAEYFRERIDCVAHAMRNGYVHPRQRALVARRLQTSDASMPRPPRQR